MSNTLRTSPSAKTLRSSRLKKKVRAEVWERIVAPVDDCWDGGTADILTIEGNCAAFAERGFNVLFSRAYHEPSWWEAYYDDREDAPHWREERSSYRADQDYLGVGLFVLEKVTQSG